MSNILTSSIMHDLWERTSDGLSKEELEWFSGATDHAVFVANTLQDLVEGVGCLVANDSAASLRAGNFQSGSDVADLLFCIANSIDNIRGLIHVGTSASHRLNSPELYQSLRKGRSGMTTDDLVP